MFLTLPASKQVLQQTLSYENEFHLHKNEQAGEKHFHKNGIALRLIFTLTQARTWKPCTPNNIKQWNKYQGL